MNCLYLHIPFCQTKCHYCSFNSFAHLESLHHRYCRALRTEISSGHGAKKPLETIFIGGGTPSVLNVEDLTALLDTCRVEFGFLTAAEISIEANPESADYKFLNALRQAGFNRLSIGIQSLNDNELKKLGRIHTGAMAQQAVINARRAGFDNLSVDLMYGLPGQTVNSWRETLQCVLDLSPRHMSAYQLSIEEHTHFYDIGEDGLGLPAEGAVLDMDETTRELCSQAGLLQYEISNFSHPGYECRHNLNYWHNGGYFGFGAGSVSYVDGVRERRADDPLNYCEAVEQGSGLITESEELSARSSFKETVVMGLRLIEGISEQRLQKRYGMSLGDVYGTTVEQLADRGLLDWDGSRLALSETGRRFANQVMAELV